LPFFNERVVELPITLPQDHTVFQILQHTDGALWTGKARDIRDRGGMVLVSGASRLRARPADGAWRGSNCSKSSLMTPPSGRLSPREVAAVVAAPRRLEHPAGR
jgi:hypothetical protein